MQPDGFDFRPSQRLIMDWHSFCQYLEEHKHDGPPFEVNGPHGSGSLPILSHMVQIVCELEGKMSRLRFLLR